MSGDRLDSHSFVRYERVLGRVSQVSHRQGGLHSKWRGVDPEIAGLASEARWPDL